MRFERVRLKNFKCFAEADLRLDRGVTVVHGVNGSGKSSLLEACFFALYGGRALDRTLDELVTIGSEEASIELWFSHGEESYHIERQIRVRDDRAKTTKCVLEEPDGVIEGARDVREAIGELLRMDHTAFLNCAYVRQGEINKLIEASPSDRQDMIDDLLQLGRLEDYRQRASDARVGVGRVLEGKRASLDQLTDQIDAKVEKNLHEQANQAKTERNEVEEELDRLETQRETARETLSDAKSVIETYETRREELTEIETNIETLRETITETEQQRGDLASEMSEKSKKREQLRTQADGTLESLALADLDVELDTEAGADRQTVESMIDQLSEFDESIRDEIESHRLEAQRHATEAESLRDEVKDLRERAQEKREKASDLESDVEQTRESLAERRDALEDLQTQIETHREAFVEAPVDVGEAETFRESAEADLEEIDEDLTDLRSSIETVSTAIEEAETLLEAGKCPECGQPVEEAPPVESLEGKRDRLAELETEREDVLEKRESVAERVELGESLCTHETELERLREKHDTFEELISEREATIEETETRIETLRSEATQLDEGAENKQEAAETADSEAADKRESIASCNKRRSSLRDCIESLEEVTSDLQRREELAEEIETHRQRREQLDELNDERRDRLEDFRDRREELAESIDDEQIQTAREEKNNSESYLEEAAEEIESLEERRDELQNRIGALENEIEELQSLRERRDQLKAVVERLESLYAEAEDLQEMYGNLRADLRQRNVETLEWMLNETFDLVYQNDSYSRIELDEKYRLTIYQKDGRPLAPDQLSGGERAVFNLSLRGAIYRLLSEGIEGTAPTPPLILDEPTVFLDSGHVTQLLELISFMREEIGVEQIVVVSHVEELVDAADDLVHVKKDVTSNRSHVERRQMPQLPTD